MRSARVWGLISMLVCSGATATLSGCSEPAAPLDQVAAEPVPLNGCIGRAPGQGFYNASHTPIARWGYFDFKASSSATAADAVFGLALGPATRFDQLAAAVRFAPSGVIDARNGGAYQADVSVPYQLGQSYPIRVVVDFIARTYSVYVQTSSDPSVATVRLAHDYAFRPTTATLSSLDTIAAIVDGPSGSAQLCDTRGSGGSTIAYARNASHTLAALPGDEALASDGISTTWKLTATGAVAGTLARGGTPAVDEAGNIYIAQVSSGQLAVYAYTAALSPRWIRTDPSGSANGVLSVAADAGGVTVALAAANGIGGIRRYPADGSPGVQLVGTSGSATHAVVDRTGFALASVSASSVTLSVFALDGTLLWSQTYPNVVRLTGLTLDLPGRLVLIGDFDGSISFGGPTLETTYHGEQDVNSFVVALDRATGAHGFTSRVPAKFTYGVAANASRVVVSSEHWVLPIFPHLYQFDPSGAFIGYEPVSFHEQWGRAGRVWVSPTSNRIFWQWGMVWPGPNTGGGFPHLLVSQ